MTDEQLIEKLGGTRVVADAINEKQATVSNWKTRGIAWRCRHKVAKLATDKMVPLPEGFWKESQ